MERREPLGLFINNSQGPWRTDPDPAWISG
jgi:hypothetical protein